MNSSTLSNVQDWTLFIEQLETELWSSTLRSRELEVPFWAWQDELARLHVLAHDMGLYQAGHTSLNETLAQLPLVNAQISRQMARIRRLVGDIEEDLSCADHSGSMDINADSESENDTDTKPTTTLQDIYIHFKDSNDILNWMSNTISQRANAARSMARTGSANRIVEGADLRQARWKGLVTMARDQVLKYPRRINEREKPIEDDIMMKVGLTQEEEGGVEEGRSKCTYAVSVVMDLMFTVSNQLVLSVVILPVIVALE
ncbi:hypothetical protein BJX62DRAFT_232339 [Aspergillus germanicus]